MGRLRRPASSRLPTRASERAEREQSEHGIHAARAAAAASSTELRRDLRGTDASISRYTCEAPSTTASTPGGLVRSRA